MKTICYYAAASHLGGAERSLMELVSGLREIPGRGYEPWVLVPQDGPLVERLRKDGIRHEILPFPPNLKSPFALFSYVSVLRKTLAREAPALIHTGAFRCHLLAAWIRAFGDVEVLWHLREIHGTGLPLYSLRTMAVFSSVSMMANSRATADAFDSSAGIPVLHGGLDPTVFFPKRNRIFNDELEISRDVPIVGIIGTLIQEKGQHDFLIMAAMLSQQGIRARYVVLGEERPGSDAGYGEFLRHEAQRLGIEDDVLFTGFRADSAEVMNGLDILVQASRRPEPFGGVVMEALACGTPVVASGAGGLLEMIVDRKSGLLFPPGDVPAMAERVKEILSFSELRERLAEEGRKVFLERFTRRHYVDGVASLYDSLLKN